MKTKKLLSALVYAVGFISIILFYQDFENRNGTESFPVNLRSEIYTKPLEKQPVHYVNLSKHDRKQVDCLAKNMYFESGAEEPAGWLAVAMVTMNRVGSQYFPKTVCEVVYQKTGRIYQFSWVGSRKALTKPDEELYNKIQKLAVSVYTNYESIIDITAGALFFHADYVNPKWGREKTAKIGRHIFYR